MPIDILIRCCCITTGFGGKGANQAVQASRLGSRVVMVTKVGDDTYGKDTIDNYKANNIDTKHVLTTSEVSSGLAPITVDKVLT
jgi:ribokinase